MDARAIGQGDLLNGARATTHVLLAARRDTSKVLLCVDSECTPVEETHVLIDAAAAHVARSLRMPVAGLVVDHALEGWLLADRRALAQYLAVSPTRLRYRNPEDDCRPAETMTRLFERVGRDFRKPDALPELARQADLAAIAAASGTFRQFQDALLGR